MHSHLERTSFIKNNREEFIRVIKESKEHADFGNSVIGTSSVPTDTSRSSSSSEKNDSVAKELDIGFQRRFFVPAELLLRRVEGEPWSSRSALAWKRSK
jgi:hypothetical protein